MLGIAGLGIVALRLLESRSHVGLGSPSARSVGGPGQVGRRRRPAAELLEGVCDVDLDALDVELPRGFGRD